VPVTPLPPDEDDDADAQLDRRILELEAALADVESVVSRLTDPRQPQFFAARLTEDETDELELAGHQRYFFRELAPHQAEGLMPMPDGRRCLTTNEAATGTPYQNEFGKLYVCAGENLQNHFLVMEYTSVNPEGTTAARYVQVPCGLFPVEVRRDGGEQGTATTAATYTYTAYDLNGGTPYPSGGGTYVPGTVLGTEMTPVKPRQIGGSILSTGSGFPVRYGLGFFHGQEFKLWDAGEVFGSSNALNAEGLFISDGRCCDPPVVDPGSEDSYEAFYCHNDQSAGFHEAIADVVPGTTYKRSGSPDSSCIYFKSDVVSAVPRGDTYDSFGSCALCYAAPGGEECPVCTMDYHNGLPANVTFPGLTVDCGGGVSCVLAGVLINQTSPGSCGYSGGGTFSCSPGSGTYTITVSFDDVLCVYRVEITKTAAFGTVCPVATVIYEKDGLDGPLGNYRRVFASALTWPQGVVLA
jgi:hypothetical protein